MICISFCLGFTCYETYIQFREYVRNGDNASIEYRNFNLEEKDQYPTFTICFIFLERGDNFDSGHASFQANNVTPSLYHSFLVGDEEDDPKYYQIVYDDVVSNMIHSYVTRFDSLGFNGSDFYMSSYDDTYKNRNKAPLSISFQHPWSFGMFLLCVSKKVAYQKNLIQTVDAIIFNATSLTQKKLYMKVFIHQAGRTMRAVRKTPQMEMSTSDVSAIRLEYEYRVDKIEVLRKRHDSNTKCDPNLLDETQITLNIIMREVGCIPAYWQMFAGDLLQTLPKCKQNQYRTIYNKYLLDPGGFKRVQTMYTQACSTMTLSAIERAGNIGKVDTFFKMVFGYEQENYKEIINKRAYTSENLLGQIGGFIGKG